MKPLGCRLRFVQADEVADAFASGVREARAARGWTQVDLARHLAETGVLLDATAITRLERGDRGVRIGEAFAIAQALGLSIEDVLTCAVTGRRALTAQRAIDVLAHAEQELARLRSLLSAQVD